jgi:hypothetical protein
VGSTADEWHVDVDVMQYQIGRLTEIVDELETVVHGGLAGLRDQQGTKRWTDIPSCVAFRDQYRKTLDTLDQGAAVLWTKVGTIVTGMQATAVDAGIVDGAVADNINAALDALAVRLAAPAPTTPSVPGTTTPSGSGSTTPYFEPGYGLGGPVTQTGPVAAGETGDTSVGEGV